MENVPFLFGAAYYDEYMPYDRIETDFKLMKEAGMNVIRIAESTWSTWEPTEGNFDFTHLHRMLDAAAKYDIRVIIGTPTYAIPGWLADKYPDIMPVTRKGQALYGPRQLHDITNEHFLFYAERIIRKLMEQVSSHPNVIGYQLDNETRSGDTYSPCAQAKFVEYLKASYPDINEFNLKFGLNYWSNRVGSWDEFYDVRDSINGSLNAAYKRFLRKCITDYLNWQAGIVDEYRRPDQFITHNFDYAWRDYSYGLQPLVDQVAAAKCMDIAGCDIYHPSQDDLTGAEIALGGAIAYSIKKQNYLVLETQSQGRTEWLPYPGQLRLAIYSHIASGARSVMYWNWHSIHNAIESYWKGILSHDLLPGETYQEISNAIHDLWETELYKKYLATGHPLTPCNEAAILLDHASLTGIEEFPYNASMDYNDVVRTYFDACYELNVHTDVVYAEDDLSRYKLVIVPALYSAGEETINKLRDYVAGGGHLLMSFKSCFADEEIKIYPDMQPHNMTDLFGMTYDRFTVPKDVRLAIADCEESYPVEYWMEMLKPLDENTEVWAGYEHKYWSKYAAVTHHAYGRGSATYVGCFADKEALKPIIRRLCSVADLPLYEVEFPLICRKCKAYDGKEITFVFNYSSEERKLPLDDTFANIPAWDGIIL